MKLGHDLDSALTADAQAHKVSKPVRAAAILAEHYAGAATSDNNAVGSEFARAISALTSLVKEVRAGQNEIVEQQRVLTDAYLSLVPLLDDDV